MFTDELIDRLSKEFSLIWYEFPLALWQKAFDNYSEYACDKFGEASEAVITSRLERIENLLGLPSHKHVLAREHQPPVPEGVFRGLIAIEINGAEGKPGLRAKHDGTRWPDKMNAIIVSKIRGLPKRIRGLVSANIPNSQKGVVYLPFVLAAASNSIEHAAIQEHSILNRYRILEMIEFDEHWFETIYSIMLGYIWQLKQ